LRLENNALQHELATEKQIQLETERQETARLASCRVKVAEARKKEREAYNKRMALASPRICPEVTQYWRE
jgi:hypothetical protein